MPLMVFNSYSFILIFLPVCIIIYRLLCLTRKAFLPKVFLLCASLFFYGFNNYKALIVLCISILVNYLISYFIKRARLQSVGKALLISGIILNLAALIYCKYLTFFASLLNSVSGLNITFSSILLPLGISFFTFSQIAYLVDVFRGADSASLLDYALFVSFFPKVTVGPIALTSEMIPQFNNAALKTWNDEDFSKGLVALSFGLAKKVLLADSFCKYVDWGYSHIAGLGSINAFIVMLAYTLQIYFDFSGYCDMARGVCLMLGLDLPVNFNSPYRSLSIAEFWKNWHITLTRFFREYVYFPLGGNRKGKFRTYLNHFIIFFLSGLWHGASVNFLIWGMLHGLGIIISKLISPFMKKVPKIIRFILTFGFVNITWIYFRADTLSTAHAFLRELFSFKLIPVNIEMVAAATPTEANLLQWLVLKFTPFSAYYSGMAVILLLLLFGLYSSIFMKNTDERIEQFCPSGRMIFATVSLLVWGILSLSEISKFIYVNF